MRRSTLRVFALCAAAMALAPSRAPAQGGLMLQGIVDAEFWATDTSSNLLTRRSGAPAGLGRLTAWGALEPWSGFVLFAAGSVERGARLDDAGRYAEFEQLGIRVTRSEGLVLDAGRMPMPVGAFAARRFSTRNPLIGVPDGYPVQYPEGVMLSGVVRGWDYRVGAVSRAVAHEGYVPEPGSAMRPVLGLGFTPFAGLRVGASGTVGPYLNDDLSDAHLDGRDWTAYRQRIGALDARFSYRYAELRAEWARSEYDVPKASEPMRGTTYYVEGRYTITPRLYAAVRHERNKYPFIRPSGTDSWNARVTDFTNTEGGIGFRLTASTLLKASYRGDDWVVTPQNASFVRPGGRAFAVQVSQTFDAVAMVERGRRR
jgi:hypothetical protein